MLTTYEDFNANQTIVYGSPATSDSANKAPLFIKQELNNLSDYCRVNFGDAPLEWNSAHNYAIGDYCVLNGVVFQATANNINSQPNNNDWEIIDILEAYRASYAWDSSINYVLYNIVISADKIYEANASNINDEPPSVNWNYIADVGSGSYSISASNLLSEIKTVDGSGSGLDADLLDGYDSDVNATADTVVVRDSSGEINGTASSAKYADLAEKYISDDEYPEGTVMAIGGDKEITKYTKDMPLAGIISENPAYKMNSEIEGIYIALKGRVPCLINGNAIKGDYIVADDNGRGIAVKTINTLDLSLKLLGISLEDGADKIEIKV